MSWTEAKGCITGYRVHCIDGISHFDHPRQLKPSELSYIIQDLRPGTSYTVSVSGLYGEEESQPIPLGGITLKTTGNRSIGGGISLKTTGSQSMGLPLLAEPGVYIYTGRLCTCLIMPYPITTCL